MSATAAERRKAYLDCLADTFPGDNWWQRRWSRRELRWLHKQRAVTGWEYEGLRARLEKR